MAISFYQGLKNYKYISSLPAKNLKNICAGWRENKIDNAGQRCRRFMPFQVHSPIAVGPKSSCEHRKIP